MKSLLLISYHFPPEQNGGVGRPYSLYQHSFYYGYNTIVVTTAANTSESADRVLRANSLVVREKRNIYSKKLAFRLLNKVCKLLGAHPTFDLLWYWEASKTIDTFLLKNKVDILYATYPSVTALLLGLRASRKFNIPLVSEFRDGLIFEPLVKLSFSQRLLCQYWESKIIDASDVVITIGDSITNYFAVRFNKKNVVTVYNGYDSLTLPENTPCAICEKKHRFIHFGSLNLSKQRDVVPLFLAISQLNTDKELTSSFSFTFVGNFTKEEKELVKLFELQDVVIFKPMVSKLDGFIDIIQNYDYLLFYGVPGDTGFISAKLMEYISIKKPILGICKGNEAEKIILETGTGKVCDFDHGDIFRLCREFILYDIQYAPDLTAVASFERSKQVGKISKILDGISVDKKSSLLSA